MLKLLDHAMKLSQLLKPQKFNSSKLTTLTVAKNINADHPQGHWFKLSGSVGHELVQQNY